MATFSTSGFVAAANGSTTVTIGPLGTSPPVPFSTAIQTTKAPSNTGGVSQAVAQQQHIFHQSLAHQQARHSLAIATAPAGSPPISIQSTAQQQTQQQQQSSMQQAFQVRR